MNIFIDHFHSLSHMLAYILMFTFMAIYWKKQIWLAIKGFNGKLQLMELLKFGAIIAFFSYCIEIIFGQMEFDIYFGSLLLIVAIASNNSKIDLGAILSNVFKNNSDSKNKEKN